MILLYIYLLSKKTITMNLLISKKMENKNSSEFLNKKIVITGASSGIGLSTAIYFLNKGAKVILAGRDSFLMETICKKYNFINAIIMKFDLISRDQCIIDFKTSIVEIFGKIDILINCAGIRLYGDIEKTYPQDFDYTLDLNLRSIYYLIYSLIGFMNKNSSIINMSCLYGTRPMCGMISHTISKAGLEGLTKYCAAELAFYGIRVNAVSSCPVMTNSLGYLSIPENEINDFYKKMEKNIPLGRMAHPDDIIKVISFLSSDRSKNITGQVIKVDGGRSLTSSGYVHYKGRSNMNARIEPDGVNIIFGVKNLMLGNKSDNYDENEIPNDEKELIKYIEDKMSESKFSENEKNMNDKVYSFIETKLEN